ncbi:MAG: hypothetical protein AAF843_10290 [Bacteroidota bacterium]
MALIELSYCNVGLGTEIILFYDDVNHVIDSAQPINTCTSKFPTPRVLYQHVDGDIEYTVSPQNTPPWAYVSERVIACQVVISNIQVQNATDEASADGIVTISGGGSGNIQYSLDNVNWQVSNQFSGLTAGSYQAFVRNTMPSGTQCFASESFEILADTVRCDLRLGTIQTTVNTINVLTLEDALQPVEYAAFFSSGGTEVWQDSPTFFLGPTPQQGQYTVKVRYKNQTSCVDTRQVLLDGVQNCDVQIEGIETFTETGFLRNDGAINVIATSTNTPIEYSINDGDYQASPQFQDLAPGLYKITVKDAGDCLDERVVTVFAFRPPFVDVPEVNPFRFIADNNDLPTAYNRLFKNMRLPGVMACDWFQPVNRDMISTVHIRSNYSQNELKVFRQDGTLQGTLPVIKKTDNTDFKATLNGVYLASLGDTAQIYFNDGLPEFAEIGQGITVAGFTGVDDGTYQVIDLVGGVGPAEGFEVMLIALPETLPVDTVVQGEVSATYDLEIFDVYESVINWGAYDNGKYYLELAGSDVRYDDYKLTSEPIQLASNHRDVQLVRWKNLENAFEIAYDTGVEFSMLLPCFFGKPIPGGERTVSEDSRRNAIKLEEYVTDNPELMLDNVPPYFAIKLSKILAHDRVYINDIAYVKTEEMEIEYYEGDPFCNATIRLRRTQTNAFNSDDAAQDVDVPQDILGLNNDLLEVNP